MAKELTVEGPKGTVTATIRPITIDHLAETLELQSQTVLELGEQTYAPFSSEKMAQVLSQDQSLGAFVEDCLVAKRLVEAPKPLDPKLQSPLNVSADQLNQVANLCGLIVSPNYRGTGLGGALTSEAIERLKQGTWCHVYSTVALTNYPTFRNLIGRGFLIRELTEMHGGKLRYIFHQNLRADPVLGNQEKQIESENIEKQQAALREGWVGAHASKEDEKFLITFKKLETKKHNQ